jgi:hypothetical protein
MRLSLAFWPLALAACGGHGAAAQPAASALQVVGSGQPPRNQCNVQAAQLLVGQRFDADTLARALAAAGADTARMLRPDSLITKEYMPGRLNVVVDADSRIVRVYCG